MSYRQEVETLSHWLNKYATDAERAATIADALGLSVDDDGEVVCEDWERDLMVRVQVPRDFVRVDPTEGSASVHFVTCPACGERWSGGGECGGDGNGTCFEVLAAIADDPAAEWASLDQPADTLPAVDDLARWAAAWREVFGR